MPAFGQGFFANTRAARARLRRPIPSRVQQDHLASSLFRFDAQDIDKRPGGRIQDRPVETGLLFDVLTGIVDRSLGGGGHIADRQFLGDDQTMPANQLGRYLVDVILAPVGNLPVALGEGPTRLSGSPRTKYRKKCIDAIMLARAEPRMDAPFTSNPALGALCLEHWALRG
jgi:hypothetical protein